MFYGIRRNFSPVAQNIIRIMSKTLTSSSSASLKPITSAGCLIIGDEVLNGKILDTNSHNFAKACFSDLEIPLKKTIVCGDDKQDIINSIKILTEQDKCDVVLTSGGIGPTHDDISYESVAAAFDLSTAIDKDTVNRMHKIRGDYLETLSKDQLDSFYRMATFPQSSQNIDVDKLYIDETLWVPVVGINQQVYMLPGVPQLFIKLLSSLTDHIRPRIVSNALTRFFVKTTSKESELAPFLKNLQKNCDKKFGSQAVKIGSYPHFSWSINTISIIGGQSVDPEDLRHVVQEILDNVGGGAKEIDAAEENCMTTTEPEK